jgi:UPF0716 protein FxsA
MPFILRFGAGLGLWLIGEFIAFSLVAQAIGLDGAILVTLATSLAGILLLRRLGASAWQTLTAVLEARGDIDLLAPERLSAGVSAGLGALLLILPGFLSDGLGLLLIARSARAWHMAGDLPRRRGDDLIELSPQDWRRIDDDERR